MQFREQSQQGLLLAELFVFIDRKVDLCYRRRFTTRDSLDGSSPKNYLGNAASDDYRGTIRGVGESLIPLVDSDRIPTAGTLKLSDSVLCNVMPLVCETGKQYATGPSSTILVLTRENKLNR